jgi:ubiquinone/menaquinone biosynthesis C-methylase UbiE
MNESSQNPFEFEAIANAYDLATHKNKPDFKWLQEGQFVYPEVFGSTGGKNYLKILQRIALNKEKISNILELGCGTGAFYEVLKMNHFSNIVYTGIDLSNKHIEKAKAYYPEACFYQGDASNLPLATNSFDFVFENNLFPFLLYPEKTIKEMIRVTRAFASFNCHATPIAGGIYCYQPLFSIASIETLADGSQQLVLPETLPEELKPKKVLPQLIQEGREGRQKVAVAKVKKRFISLKELEHILKNEHIEIIERRESRIGKYPAILNYELANDNSLNTALKMPDSGATTEDDMLMGIDGLDVEIFLHKNNN